MLKLLCLVHRSEIASRGARELLGASLQQGRLHRCLWLRASQGWMEHRDAGASQAEHPRADFSIQLRKGSNTPPQGTVNRVRRLSASARQRCQPLLSRLCFVSLQVDPRGTLQVQIQPTWGKARQRGEVVDSEEDRPLLPRCQPPGPEEVLRRQELAVPRAGLMEEDEQGQEGPAGEEGEQSAPLQTICLASLCIFYPYPCLHIFYRRFPANLSTCCCGLVFLIFLFLSVHPSRHGCA